MYPSCLKEYTTFPLAQHEINETLGSINFKEILCDFDKNIKPTDDKLGN